MKTWLKLCWPPMLAVGLLLMVLVQPFQAQDKKHANKDLANSLREVINTGADMYNLRGDHAGCYRVYQGALVAIKPFVPQDLQNEIATGLARAEQMPRMSDRAFELRRVIDLIRAQMKGEGPSTKDGDKKDGKKDGDKKDGKKDGDKKDDKKDGKKDGDKKDDKKDGKKDSDKKLPANTLWDRLGGEDNVARVVSDFVATAGPDPKVNVTRNGKFKVNAEELQVQLIAFFSQYTGGPYKYTGKSMKEAHKGMGITDAEFNAAAGHLKAALVKNKAAPKDADAVMALVEGMRKDIVEGPGKKGEVDKKDGPIKLDGPAKDFNPKKDGEPKSPPPVKAEKTSKLSGKVTLDGKALSLAYVTFTGDNNRKFTTLVKDGSYAFRTPLPEGQYRILFEPAGGKGVQVDLPKKYSSAETSTLTTRVEGPQAQFDITLQSK